MSDKNTETKAVYALTERNEKTFWTRIGAAFHNKDGSVTVALDALPVSGRLQIRENDRDDRDDRDAPNDRKGRR
jgi:hypothetical protein